MKRWADVLADEKRQPYFQTIMQKVNAEIAQGKVIYPPHEAIFNAFRLTEFGAVKAVILGQDPYHGPGQAHGLAFSVRPQVRTPPSLVNIYKELSADIEGFTTPSHGYLKAWTTQGVLLLNTVLTVEQGKANSHADYGWETFTDHVIAKLEQEREHLVFMLWGSHAQKKGKFIDRARHCVLSAPHPSPLSAHRGFLGCGHFSKANRYLSEHGIAPIDWQLPLEVNE
ncbi:uracil-DNA glycosylase [Pasteurellaceae bacterium HPA106]|uniref:uracil-DNA glycosylase n=1 Tax=Spirabiliibacterium pneumoniae TaxID=221400 RepID=UPI001AAD2C4F|nr:uracil-DNA glycosylase [Spirabiliibacterium pneumoniae]MBE2895816.1 uracil-DNA glycosylase [Spirabiliibacterium pneumoniae]